MARLTATDTQRAVARTTPYVRHVAYIIPLLFGIIVFPCILLSLLDSYARSLSDIFFYKYTLASHPTYFLASGKHRETDFIPPTADIPPRQEYDEQKAFYTGDDGSYEDRFGDRFLATGCCCDGCRR